MCPRRPRTHEEIARDNARRHADKALDTLVALLDHDDGHVRIEAAMAIATLAYGPPEPEPDLSTVDRDRTH